MARIMLAHPPQDRESLYWAVRALFKVAIPRTRVCPDHCSPFDAFADAYFGQCTIRDGVAQEPEPISQAIWHASRGLAGKSMGLSVLGLSFGYFLGADITVLGGSMSQSANVHEYMSKGMANDALPPEMLLDQTATRIVLSNRGRMRPLPASQKNVRGPHPSILLADEVDEMEIDIYDAALGQPMPQVNWLGNTVPTFTVVSSTWQHPNGTLTEIFRRNDEGGGRIPVYRWCYLENLVENNPPGEGWLTPDTVADKRESVSAAMWSAEYDLGEPAIGNRAFDTAAVDAVFCLPFAPVRKEVRKDFEEYTFAAPVRGAAYVAAADWAKEADKTAIGIVRIDDNRRELVYFARMNRLPYPTMIGYFNKAVGRYRVAVNGAWHDSTGLGNVVNDYLERRAKPFKMTGDRRTKLLSDFVNAIEKSATGKAPWRLPKIPSMYTEMKFCRTGDLYASAAEFHLPDTVCMLALAEYAARRVVPSVAPIAVGDRSEPSALARSLSHQPEEQHSATSPDPELEEVKLWV